MRSRSSAEGAIATADAMRSRHSTTADTDGLTTAVPERALPRGVEVRRHPARAKQEGGGMHTHGDQPSAPPLAESTTTLLASDLRPADTSTVEKGQRSETIWHNLDGLVVQRNDAHRMLIIAGRWIQLSPTQYALLIPLLEHFGHPVSHAEIYWGAFGSTYSPRDARRTYYHIDKLRPRLSPFGLLIRTIIDHGYMLLREPREP